MAVNQDVRSGSSGSNNPFGLFQYIKPMRLIVDTRDPEDTDGESEWLWINSVTGNLFNKVENNGSSWLYVFSFSTGTPTPGITDIVNDGPATFGLFNGLIGTTAHFKSLTQNPNNKIQLTSNPTTVSIGLGSLNTSDVGIPLVINTKYVTNFAGPPTPNNDSSQGFQVGNLWSDYTNNNLYMCTSTVINNAVWNLLNPEFPITIRSDNDFCFLQMQPGPNQTGFTAYSTRVLLNIGFGTYTIINRRGTWQTVNSGFGPVNIIYGPPRNFLAGNNYMVTYNWYGNIANPGAAPSNDQAYYLQMNTGTGGNPSAGLIEASGAQIDIPPGGRYTSTTKTFVYNFPTNGTVNFFMSVYALLGPPGTPATLSTNEFTITFTQI